MTFFKTAKLLLREALIQPQRIPPGLCRKFGALVKFDYRFFKNGYSFHPTDIQFDITHRCNLRCLMCSLFKEGSVGVDLPRAMVHSNQDLLSFEEMKAFFDEISSFKPAVLICGGEPLLHKDVFRVIKYIKDKKMGCTLVTNGTLLEKHAQVIVDSGLANLSVSLDGPEAIHDEIRGGKGIYRKAIDGIKAINEIKSREGKRTPLVTIAYTVSNKNYRYLKETFLSVTREVKINSFQFSHLNYWTKGMVEKHNCLYQDKWKVSVMNTEGLSGIDIQRLAEELKMVKTLNAQVPITIVPDLNSEEIKLYYQKPLTFVKRNRCLQPWRCFFLYPNGDVAPCVLDYTIGNIKKEGFRDLWNNDRFRQFRKALKNQGAFPACSRCCGLFVFK